jgi:hypothetical protein
MRRIVGIIIFAFGLLVWLSHVLMSVPGTKWLGFFTMFTGALVFGLSFIPQPEPAPGEKAPAPMPPAERLTRVFYEPEPVFNNLRHYPRWLGAFLILAFFTALYQIALLQRLGPERFADDRTNRILDGGLFQSEKLTPEDFRRISIEQAKAGAAVEKITAPFWTIGGTFLVMLFLAGLYLLGVLAFGGRMNFWQALSVAAYGSLPPVVIATVLNLILLYVQSPDDIVPYRAQQRGLARADLGILLSPVARPILYTFASSIGLFSLYGWWLSVTGLKHTGEKISGGSAWTIALILWLLGVVIMMVIAMLLPTFVA